MGEHRQAQKGLHVSYQDGQEPVRLLDEGFVRNTYTRPNDDNLQEDNLSRTAKGLIKASALHCGASSSAGEETGSVLCIWCIEKNEYKNRTESRFILNK